MITSEKAGEIAEDMKELCDNIKALHLPPLTEEDKMINDQMFEEWGEMFECEYNVEWKAFHLSSDEWKDRMFGTVPNATPELKNLAWRFAHLMDYGIELRHYFFRNNDVLVKNTLAECSWDFLDDWRIMGHLKYSYPLKKIKEFHKIIGRYQDTELEKEAIKAFVEFFKSVDFEHAQNAKDYAREWVKNIAPYLKKNDTKLVKSTFESNYNVNLSKSFRGSWTDFRRAMEPLGFALNKNG